MTIVELITIILFFFFFGYGLVRFFMDLTEYVAWRWQKMSEKRFDLEDLTDKLMMLNMIGVCILSWIVMFSVLLSILGVL